MLAHPLVAPLEIERNQNPAEIENKGA